MTEETKPAAETVAKDAPVPTAKPSRTAKTAAPANPGSEPLWAPGEEVPSAGGSWIRRPDGSLVRDTEEEA